MKKKLHNPISGDKLRAGMLIFCCFSLLIIGICGVGFASFHSSTMNDDITYIAAFAGTANTVNGSGDLEIDCNTDVNVATYRFSVSNIENGTVIQVNAKYKVIVNLSEALPSGVTVKLDGADGTSTNGGKTYTFTNNGWIFMAGVKKSTEHSLVFTADPTVVVGDTTISNVSVSVEIEQIN